MCVWFSFGSAFGDMFVFGLVFGARLLWPKFSWFRFGSAEVQLVGGLFLFGVHIVSNSCSAWRGLNALVQIGFICGSVSWLWCILVQP